MCLWGTRRGLKLWGTISFLTLMPGYYCWKFGSPLPWPVEGKDGIYFSGAL